MYTFGDIDTIIQTIRSEKRKLVYVAGASASGKSYFAEELAKRMQEQGLSVLTISSDMYYTNTSALKYLLYGSYDHPALIDYPQLAQDINTYFTQGNTRIPEYSFVEKRTVGYKTVTQQYDVVLVEGLYSISQLPDTHNPCKLFVFADEEELIFRRLIRDQQRTKDPLHVSIAIMSKVFPMRNLYGKQQKQQSDIVVYNDFEILKQHGVEYEDILIEAGEAHTLGELDLVEHITDFEYDDTNDDNGKILISEVYTDDNELLNHVQISRSQKTGNNYKSISIKLYEPGILTGLHSLLQLAGLRLIKQVQKVVSYYKKENTTHIIQTKAGKMYQKKQI